MTVSLSLTLALFICISLSIHLFVNIPHDLSTCPCLPTRPLVSTGGRRRSSRPRPSTDMPSHSVSTPISSSSYPSPALHFPSTCPSPSPYLPFTLPLPAHHLLSSSLIYLSTFLCLTSFYCSLIFQFPYSILHLPSIPSSSILHLPSIFYFPSLRFTSHVPSWPSYSLFLFSSSLSLIIQPISSIDNPNSSHLFFICSPSILQQCPTFLPPHHHILSSHPFFSYPPIHL